MAHRVEAVIRRELHTMSPDHLDRPFLEQELPRWTAHLTKKEGTAEFRPLDQKFSAHLLSLRAGAFVDKNRVLRSDLFSEVLRSSIAADIERDGENSMRHLGVARDRHMNPLKRNNTSTISAFKEYLRKYGNRPPSGVGMGRKVFEDLINNLHAFDQLVAEQEEKIRQLTALPPDQVSRGL